MEQERTPTALLLERLENRKKINEAFYAQPNALSIINAVLAEEKKEVHAPSPYLAIYYDRERYHSEGTPLTINGQDKIGSIEQGQFRALRIPTAFLESLHADFEGIARCAVKAKLGTEAVVVELRYKKRERLKGYVVPLEKHRSKKRKDVLELEEILQTYPEAPYE